MKSLGLLLIALLAISVVDSLWDDFETYEQRGSAVGETLQ